MWPVTRGRAGGPAFVRSDDLGGLRVRFCFMQEREPPVPSLLDFSQIFHESRKFPFSDFRTSLFQPAAFQRLTIRFERYQRWT
jgi:hypothetical protein